jgi:flagellar basal body-associated protein FliL
LQTGYEIHSKRKKEVSHMNMIILIVIFVVVIAGALGFSFFIEWLQNRETKEKPGKSKIRT